MARTSMASLTSSPDLLGEPGNNPRSSPVRDSKRAFTATPTKQRSRLGSHETVQLQDFYLTTPTGKASRQVSPTRSVAEAENLISPWRIRVRVEAEREDEDTKSVRGRGKRTSTSPSKQVARTITTTIPLKDGDDTPGPQKRGRGRPRKSTTPAKRPGTPKPGPGRPRKRAAGEDTDGDSDASKSTPKRARRQRTPRRASSHADSEEEHNPTEESAERTKPQESTSRSRMERDHVKTEKFDIAVDSDASMRYASDTEPEKEDADHEKELQNQVMEGPSNAGGSSKRQPLSSTSTQKGRPRRQSLKQHEPIPSDPAAPRSEYDSIVEGEDFSIVSLSTLPSAQQHLGAKAVLAQSTSIKPAHTVEGPPDHRATTNAFREEGLDLGQNLAISDTQKLSTLSQNGSRLEHSSLLNINLQRKTPSQVYSSPQLPPIPQVQTVGSPRALAKPTNGTPKLARVVRAGIALQGVIEPTPSTKQQTPDQAPNQSTKDRLDDLFSGFGVATRRELRAGLRLGEELARRQMQADEHTKANLESEDDVFQAIAKADSIQSLPEHSSGPKKSLIPAEIKYPSLSSRKPLPSPETSSNSNDENPSSSQLKMTNAALHLMAKPDGISQAQLRRNREAQWQNERDAVSRQIDEAFSSQVIVLNESLEDGKEGTDSDDDNEDHHGQKAEETDIWQTEAKSSSHLQGGHSQSVLGPIAEEFASKRTALPKSWTRHVTQETEPQNSEPLQKADHSIHNDSMLSRKPRRRFTPYTTPSPEPQPNPQNANYTGLTNFTTDMMESESRAQLDRPSTGKEDNDSIYPDKKAVSESAHVIEQSSKLEQSESTKSTKRASMPAPESLFQKMGLLKSQRAVTEPAIPKPQEARSQSDSGKTLSLQKQVAGAGQKPISKPKAKIDPQRRGAISKKRSKRHTSTGLTKSQETNVSMIVNASSTFLDSSDPSQSASTRATNVARTAPLDSKKKTWATLFQAATTPILQSATSALSHFGTTTPFLPCVSAPFSSSPNPVPETFAVATPPSKPQPSQQEHLTTYLPFTNTHWTHLRAIYLGARRYPRSFPLRHDSPCTRFLGTEVQSLGWRRELQAWELAVVDEFMVLLLEEGVSQGSQEENSKDGEQRSGEPKEAKREIAEEDVVKRVFSLWVGMVQRGEAELREGVAGAWDEKLVGRREQVLGRQREWNEARGRAA